MTFNGAQFHLLVNHLPVVGYPIAFVALVWARMKKDEAIFVFGCVLTAAMALSTGLADLTGEGAEHVLKAWPDFDRHLVHSHEDMADVAMIVGGVTGAIAFLLLPFVRRRIGFANEKIWRSLTTLLLVGSASTSILLGVTAHRGGLIRHPEIRDAGPATESAPGDPQGKTR